MLNLLQQPYPSSDLSVRQQLLRAAAIGGFVGFFLLIFQPFGLNIWQTDYKELKIAGFGLISFVITFTHFFVWPRLLPHLFNEKDWTVGKEVLHIVSNILLIAVANRYYLTALVQQESTWRVWGWVLLITFLIGIFPTAGIVLGNYIIQLKKYSTSARQLSVHSTATDIVRPQHPIISPITLIAENEKDSIVIPEPDELLFIESSDNYCTVCYLKDNAPVKALLRSSLSRIESQLLATDSRQSFIRCHRSFIVNIEQVERITGNAQGYKLHLFNGQLRVPVARKYNDTLIAELKRTTL